MSKLKRYAYILLIAMSIELIVPSIKAMAIVTNNTKNENTVSFNNLENDERNINGSSVIDTTTLENENIDNNLDKDNNLKPSNEVQNSDVSSLQDEGQDPDSSNLQEQVLDSSVRTLQDEAQSFDIGEVKDEAQNSNVSVLKQRSASVIEGTIENITSPHKLTADFFVKGYFVSTNTITKVEVFIDGKKIGDAKYGLARQDIGDKYKYPNSANSGFEFPVRGVSDGSHELKVIATNSEGIKKESTASITTNNSKKSIMGMGTLKKEQMVNFLHRNNPSKPMSYILNFVDLVISEAALEGVDHDVLFSQIMNETAFLKFTGDVKEEQNNFAGIGATGNGNPGNSFPSIQIGIRAVVQHLKAYASAEPLKMGVVDPRFNYVQRESAIFVEHLGIKENPNYKGWATAKEYGYRLLSMIDNVRNESSSLRYSYLTQFSNNGQAKLGEKVTLTATANQSSGISYKFEVLESGSDTWKTIGDWSSKNTLEYIPAKTGNHKFKVSIRSIDSTVDDYKTLDLNVITTKSKVKSLNISGNRVIGSPITMTASADPSDSTLYKLWVCDRSTNTWTVLSDWSTKNAVNYTPSKAGRYTFTVHVKHKSSTSNVEDDYKSVDVDVIKPISKVSSLTVTGNKVAGSKLTMSANGTPEADTLYKLWVGDRQTGTWTVLSDWSTKKTIDYTPRNPGNYTFTVHVKHKNSNSNVEDDYRSVDVKVDTGKSSVANINVEGNMFLGSTLKLKAEANPSDSTLYKLWICDRSTNTWTVLSDWSTTKAINYTPNKTGKYTFTVHVKHKYNTGNVEDDYKSVDFYVTKKNESMVIDLNITGEVKKGNTLTISATAAPEADTLYKLWVCDRQTGVWTVLSDWSAKRTATYKIPDEGNYTFTVHVKHKNSANINEDDYLSKDIFVKDKITIVVDPGHNHGGDYGAVSNINGKKYEETELNMQVAELLRKELVSRGYNVVMTREVGDKLYDELRPSLQKRVNLANSLKADLFVSIHHNTSGDSRANGVEVYYSDEKPESGTANSNKVSVSKKLSEVMVNNLSKAVGQTNRGAKNYSFYVVKNTFMPSVLVETGFITNPEEINKISKPETQKVIATQLANSIDSILN